MQALAMLCYGMLCLAGFGLFLCLLPYILCFALIGLCVAAPIALLVWMVK